MDTQSVSVSFALAIALAKTARASCPHADAASCQGRNSWTRITISGQKQFFLPLIFFCNLGRIADHMNRTEAHCFETVESPDHAIATTKSSHSPTSRHTPQQNPRETSSTVPAPASYIQRRTHQTPVARGLPYNDHAIPSS